MTERWMTPSDILALSLPGLPSSKPALLAKADREDWPSRPRQGRGGGKEYAVSALPQAARDALALRRVANLPAPVQQELPLPAPAELRNWQRETLTARAIVLAHVQNMARDCGSILKAEALFAEAAAAGTLLPALQQAARTANARAGASRSLSPQTLRRWRTEAAKTPDAPTVLAPKHSPITKTPEWLEPLLDAYATPAQRSISEVMELVAKRHPNLTLPSIRTAQRTIESLGPLARNAGRLSARELKRYRAFVKRDFSMLEPLDVISADGHCFKGEVRHYVTGRPVRPELITVIDIATRRVTGWSAGLAEGAWLVADALRHAAAEGIAAIFYTDNGPGFVNEHLDGPSLGVLARIGTVHKTAIAYNAQARGVIEHLQSSLWHRAARALPTYTGPRMSDDARQAVYKKTRADLKAHGSSALLIEWDAFMEFCAAQIAAYNDRPHSALPKILCPITGTRRPQTPNEAWAGFVERGWQPIQHAPELLADLFRPAERRKVNRATIALGGHVYFSRELDVLDLHGTEVMVGYDIHDARRVWVSHLDGRRICVAERDAHATPYFSETETAAARAQRKRTTDKLNRLEEHAEAARAELNPFLRVVDADFAEVPDALRAFDAQGVGDASNARDAPALVAPVSSPVPAPSPGTRPNFGGDRDYAVWLLANPAEITPSDRAYLRELLALKTFRDGLQFYGIDGEALARLAVESAA